MLDIGFRPAIDRIVALCPTTRQTLFFSATLDGDAGRLAKEYTHQPVVHERGPTARRASTDVEHRFLPVSHEYRIEALVDELQRDRELALVFVRTKRGADRLVKRLQVHGVQAVAMHGNKSQRQREQALARFESGAVDTLVATDVAARGIDVSGISHVINFDPARRQRDIRSPHRAHGPRRGEGHRHHAGQRRLNDTTSAKSRRDSASSTAWTAQPPSSRTRPSQPPRRDRPRSHHRANRRRAALGLTPAAARA